jgi:hypothetical protein
MINELVPANVQGKPSDLEYTVSFPSLAAAIDCYNRASKRLLNPPVWHQLAGWASANFQLVGSAGEESRRLAREGDYLRIDIPGPGPKAGQGYDWVKVDRLEDHSDPQAEREWIGMRVRSWAAPFEKESDSAHFFKSDATSTYVIERIFNQVKASYHGRNEVANTSTTEGADNLRNGLVAAGAILGLSEIQWTALCKSFLEEEIGG